MLSAPLLSNATAALIDHDSFQLYHVNRSAIFTSSTIDFSEGEGLDKLIASIIAIYHLSFKQNPVLDTLHSKNTEFVWNSKTPKNDRVAWDGNKRDFSGIKAQDDFTVCLGDIVFRDPAPVGRSTMVLTAACGRWPKNGLVVKFSWQDSGRVSETDFLKRANDGAQKTSGKWATKHLPRTFYSKDVVPNPDSTLDPVARLFDNVELINGKYEYERRIVRVIVQERLHPIKSLTNVRDIGQVFVDVVCSKCVLFSRWLRYTYTRSVHRWLYDEPGILHRDLSLDDIMYRIIEEVNAEGGTEEKVYGVLNDYDHSLWTAFLATEHTKTSRLQTRTPCYTAQDLLLGESDIHLYRHDAESLFYIMLLMCGHHTIGTPEKEKKPRVLIREGKLPYRRWLNQRDDEDLGVLRHVFFFTRPAIEVSPPFEDFCGWLRALRYSLSEGFKSKLTHLSNEEGLPEWILEQAGRSAGQVEHTHVPFDNETLGGHVNYSAVIKPVCYLKGKLEGLIIRYGPTSSPLPAPTGVV